jgi:hypothetical protein
MQARRHRECLIPIKRSNARDCTLEAMLPGDEHSLRRTKDGYFVGSNFPVGSKLMKAETNFDPNNKASSPNARRARWERLMAEYKGKIDVEAAKKFETDGFDAFAKKQGANERSLCGAVESSPRGVPEWDWLAYFPGGAAQAKVMDARMAEKAQLMGSYCHACAPDYIAEDFLKRRKEYEWMRGLLRDRRPGIGRCLKLPNKFESAPRAVASVSPCKSRLWKQRSLPLAAPTLKGCNHGFR